MNAGDDVFDLAGALPTGTTVLEASAGTGKTYAIAALAARFVAAGVPLEALLVVTFTKAATSELRDRVRERLVTSEAALEDAVAGRGAASDDLRDEVTSLLCAGPPEELRRRHARLRRAVADFDGATITTTHGFCREVLAGLGTLGDVERDVAFVEDVSDVERHVVDDLFVRRFLRERPAIGHDEAVAVAGAAIGDPTTRVVPDGHGSDAPAMRARLGVAARELLVERKRRAGVLTYDDLLTRLRDTLAGPDGHRAAARLRDRYRVVLVDEFQDTDPVQWEILDRAFGDTAAASTAADTTAAHGGESAHAAGSAAAADAGGPARALVLIGDPKQAIYAFRGADVHAYLAAARAPRTRRATLATNRRSDPALLAAYDALLTGARLGHRGIEVRSVGAPAGTPPTALHDAPVGTPLRVRMVLRDDLPDGTTPKGHARKPAVRAHVARDLAADVARLLGSAATLRGRDGASRPIRPGDVAVLVRRNREADELRAALADAGVPAVINGAGSVFATAAAAAWTRLLEALERPSAAGRARTVALTPFVGWTADAVAAADDAALEGLHRRLHRWARVLRERGVAALVAHLGATSALPARTLARAGGERELTDLRHVGQLLHAAATADGLGVTALATWLRERIAEAAREGDEERSRRLESDAAAVQVLTVHRSKGLEFGIVYLPSLFDPSWIPGKVPVAFHDPADGERTLHLGLGGAGWEEGERLHEAEVRGEDLRLAYVALTRARHQAVVWWAGTWDGAHGPLSRLLFARGADGDVPARGHPVSDPDAAERLRALVADGGGHVRLERSTVADVAAPAAAAAPPVALEAARLGRTLDVGWRRTSYTALTAGAGHAPGAGVGAASEPESLALDDEPDLAEPGVPPGAAAVGRWAGAAAGVGAGPAAPGANGTGPGSAPSPMVDLPGGTGFGIVVHRVLERVDFAAEDLDVALADAIAVEAARRPADAGDPAVLGAALRRVLETPLGPAFAGLRLRDVRRADRLDELAFELPLDGGDARRAGGEDTSARVRLADVADVLRAHDADGPLAGYADRLRDPGLATTLRGFLTGSLDLVVRLPDGRFALFDHKTNRLAPAGAPLRVGDHAPERLAAEMRRAHYPLQALLYAVALHRYLRWRLRGYDPDRHLAGVGYLFLRGMAGPDAVDPDGHPYGVAVWRPDGALVGALSDVLDGAGA